MAKNDSITTLYCGFAFDENDCSIFIDYCYDIEALAPEILADKDKTILVYCRSGRRSETAAKSLIKMGYTNTYDFGGIIDWPYKTVSGDT